jgi:hypothetical protein
LTRNFWPVRKYVWLRRSAWRVPHSWSSGRQSKVASMSCGCAAEVTGLHHDFNAEFLGDRSAKVDIIADNLAGFGYT